MNAVVDLKSYAPKTAAAIQNAMKADFAALPPQPPKLLSADVILNTDWPEPRWAVPGILPAGLCILGGRPKIGKSWLSLQLAQSVASGGVCLGQKVEPGPALVLALEDPPRRLQERMRAQRWPAGLPCDFLTLESFQDTFGSLNGSGAITLSNLIEDKNYKLCVIDTFSRSIQGDQNAADEMSAALSPLQQVSQELNCCVLIIDHLRKTNGSDADVVTDVLGSVSKAAMCDCLLGLYRQRGKRGAKLMATGRDVIEQTLQLEWDSELSCWQRTDSGDALPEKEQEILDVIERMERAKLAEIVEITRADRANTYRRLQQLVNKGCLEYLDGFYGLSK